MTVSCGDFGVVGEKIKDSAMGGRLFKWAIIQHRMLRYLKRLDFNG
jgi:hypothetical protein